MQSLTNAIVSIFTTKTATCLWVAVFVKKCFFIKSLVTRLYEL